MCICSGFACNLVKWKNVEVALKLIDKDSISINTKLRLEAMAMTSVRHPNLVPFVGVCCDTPCLCILMQMVPKGSLDDILTDGSFQLDWSFKYSLFKVQRVCNFTIYSVCRLANLLYLYKLDIA